MAVAPSGGPPPTQSWEIVDDNDWTNGLASPCESSHEDTVSGDTGFVDDYEFMMESPVTTKYNVLNAGVQFACVAVLLVQSVALAAILDSHRPRCSTSLLECHCRFLGLKVMFIKSLYVGISYLPACALFPYIQFLILSFHPELAQETTAWRQQPWARMALPIVASAAGLWVAFVLMYAILGTYMDYGAIAYSCILMADQANAILLGYYVGGRKAVTIASIPIVKTQLVITAIAAVVITGLRVALENNRNSAKVLVPLIPLFINLLEFLLRLLTHHKIDYWPAQARHMICAYSVVIFESIRLTFLMLAFLVAGGPRGTFLSTAAVSILTEVLSRNNLLSFTAGVVARRPEWYKITSNFRRSYQWSKITKEYWPIVNLSIITILGRPCFAGFAQCDGSLQPMFSQGWLLVLSLIAVEALQDVLAFLLSKLLRILIPELLDIAKGPPQCTLIGDIILCFSLSFISFIALAGGSPLAYAAVG